MSDIIKRPMDNEEKDKIGLTMAKTSLQWWINKQKNDSKKDYSAQIQFARFRLERVSGQKVKLRK